MLNKIDDIIYTLLFFLLLLEILYGIQYSIYINIYIHTVLIHIVEFFHLFSINVTLLV
jgi:hypothetical protein